ncbi:MAG TPA: HlyD family type I secretion periplasmic adaptor subunit [Stellaceae bacterium]|nr:HlyD family type I secretion periplasmic adaptor subunit [Stellaceae bacterium]
MTSWRPSNSTRSDAAVLASFRSETSALLAERDPLLARWLLRLAAAALASAIVAAGFVKIDRIVTGGGHIYSLHPTMVVQSLDRAIITSLTVHEGDRVAAGQVLATLDPTFAAADVAQLNVQIESLNAQIGRLEAEHETREISPGDLPPRYVAMQQALWLQRHAEHDQRLRGFDAKIAEYQATLDKAQANIKHYTNQLQVMSEVEDIRHKLYDLKDGSRLTFLEATNQRLQLARSLEQERNALAETQHALESARAERETFLRQWQGQVDAELIQHRTERDAAMEQLVKATKRNDLIDLRATTDAIVLHVGNFSVGSVLPEATPLLTLVPVDAPLEAEIHIDAQEIGFVRPGDPVAIKVEAYNYLEHGTVEGHLRVLSADAFTTSDDDKATPVRAYYKGYIMLDRVDLHGVPQDFKLVQGTPVTADIQVGQRTLLSYLARGALRSVDESMREP